MTNDNIPNRTYADINENSDTHELLARARTQGKKRNFDDVFIVDVDAHVGDNQNWADVLSFIDNPVIRDQAFAFGPTSASRGALLNGQQGLQWQHVAGRIPHGAGIKEQPEDKSVPREVALARKTMTSMGLDYQVMFPNGLLFLGMHPVPEMEVELGNAYNRWMVEKVLPADPRVKGMLYLPMNTPEAAEATVKRFLGKPGVAGFLITSSRHKPVHANEYMRTYRMLEEADQALGFHAHYNWQNEYTTQLNRFLSVHAISFVLCNMVHLANWVINGMNVRFPKLKVVWVESGLAWVPFMMQRFDHEFLMRPSEAPLLKMPPSEYMKQMFYTSQPMEQTNMKLLEGTFEAMNAKSQLLYCSDWPHWDFDLPSKIWDLPFLDEDAKRNILGLNAARVYGLEVPSKYRKPTKQAAE